MHRCRIRYRNPRGIVAAVWVGVSVATAGVSPQVAGAAAHTMVLDEEADTLEAKRLYNEGRVHFETAEYMEALESFKGAYRRAQTISSETFRSEVLVALLFNLARAQVKACTIDGDLSHLRQAEDLLETYLASESAMVDEADADELKAEIAAIKEEIAAEPEGPTGGEGPANPEESPTSSPGGENDDTPTDSGGSGLVLAGGVLMGLSAVGLGLMTGGIVGANRAEQDFVKAPNSAERDTIDARGQRMNGLAIAGGISAGVLLTAGLALLVVGKKRQRSNLALDVSASPAYTGLGLRGRF